MGDLISREAAIRAINAFDYRGLSLEDVRKVTDGCAAEMNKLPTVDAEPVRRGEWQYSTKYQEASFGLLDDENCDDYICKVEARCPFCGKGWNVVGVFSSEAKKEEAKKKL